MKRIFKILRRKKETKEEEEEKRTPVPLRAVDECTEVLEESSSHLSKAPKRTKEKIIQYQISDSSSPSDEEPAEEPVVRPKIQEFQEVMDCFEKMRALQDSQKKKKSLRRFFGGSLVSRWLGRRRQKETGKSAPKETTFEKETEIRKEDGQSEADPPKVIQYQISDSSSPSDEEPAEEPVVRPKLPKISWPPAILQILEEYEKSVPLEDHPFFFQPPMGFYPIQQETAVRNEVGPTEADAPKGDGLDIDEEGAPKSPTAGTSGGVAPTSSGQSSPPQMTPLEQRVAALERTMEEVKNHLGRLERELRFWKAGGPVRRGGGGGGEEVEGESVAEDEE